MKHCVVNNSSETYMSKQGFPYLSGISNQTAGSDGICMHVLHLPPRAVEKAHLHRNHETAIYIVSGVAEFRYGVNLEHHGVVRAGEFLFIPPNIPHLPRNPSETEECLVVLARTDPNEQESVELLPELDKLVPEWRKSE